MGLQQCGAARGDRLLCACDGQVCQMPPGHVIQRLVTCAGRALPAGPVSCLCSLLVQDGHPAASCLPAQGLAAVAASAARP